MHLKFSFLPLLLFLFPLIPLYGQERPGLSDIIVDSAAYRPVQRYQAVGLSFRSTKDKALSPLLFQGPGIAFSASSRKYNKRWLWLSSFAAEAHLLQNEPASSFLSSIGFSYQLSAIKEFTELRSGKWRFFAGPEARMLLNMRMHSHNVNNIAAYDWATAIGLSAMLSRKFTLWKRTFAFSNQLQLPLLYLYARPPYAWGISPSVYEEQEGSWKEAFQAGTLNDIMLIGNQLNLDFYLSKKRSGRLLKYRAYRIAYSWEFFRISTGNLLQSGGHQLTFSRVITF